MRLCYFVNYRALLTLELYKYVRYYGKSVRMPGLKLEIWIRQSMGARPHFHVIVIIQLRKITGSVKLSDG